MGKDERSFISREEYDALLAENAELNKKLDYLMGQLRLLKQKTFGVSSEQATEQLVGQLSLLFNEAEAWTPKEEQPTKSTTVSAHTREEALQQSGWRSAREHFGRSCGAWYPGRRAGL